MTSGTKDDEETKTRTRRDSADVRERAVGDREHAAVEREESVQTREELVSAREDQVEARFDRHRLMEDLKAANEKLTLLSIHSQEMAEEAEASRRLVEASERELREAAEFRERLIGVVSHDLRNPLGAIWVSLEVLLRNQKLDAEGHELALRIRRSADRMANMIVQLLDFTRAHDGGGIPIAPAPTRLDDVCRHVVEELELRYSAPGRFRCEGSGDLSGTWDAERLGQVIANLGGNAIEHGTPKSEIEIRMTDAGAEVVLQVRNQGNPIPPDLAPTIFAPFRRARRHLSSRGAGLGLGLYISEQIVHAHGGSIAARSTATETTFTVRLPRHPPEAAPAPR